MLVYVVGDPEVDSRVPDRQLEEVRNGHARGVVDERAIDLEAEDRPPRETLEGGPDETRPGSQVDDRARSLEALATDGLDQGRPALARRPVRLAGEAP
jgi:hypothetical protein